MKTILASLAFVLLSTKAFGAMGFDDLQAVTKLAYEDFVAAHPDMAAGFNGYKAWQSGDDAKVIIYMSHDGMSMQYSYVCHRHEEGLECHAQ